MVGAAWFWSAIGLYGVASALYLGFLVGLKERAIHLARVMLTAGFVTHMCEIGARGLASMHPVTSVREALGLISWLIVGGYLSAQFRWRLAAVGAFVAPAGLALLMTARLSPQGGAAVAGLGVLGRVHISLATAGVSIFALATALAVIYLFEERQLKQKHLGAFVKKGVALETLDTLVHRCVQIGFPIFTVAIVTGAIWGARSGGGLRPEYTIAMVAWTAFAALLIARVAAGWRGRRAALMTILGFSSAVVVLAIYLARYVAGG